VRWLLLVFLALPILEILVLTKIGAAIGWGATLLLVVAAGFAGTWLTKHEGIRALQRWQTATAQGLVPDEGVLDGVLLLAGGAMLILPGVITDVLGLLLVLRPSRRLVARWLRPWLARRVRTGTVTIVDGVRVLHLDGGGALAGRTEREIIDADFEVREDDAR
jgi:UPF0716 protein FxsA